MIKVIVAIAGLALVEAPNKGPIYIHIAKTTGFDNVTPLLDANGKAKAFPMDEHKYDVYGATPTLPNNFRLTIKVKDSGGNHDLAARDWFPDLEDKDIIDVNRSSVRQPCGFTSTMSGCVGKGSSGSRALLAGQVKLLGTWRLLAADTAMGSTDPVRPIEDEKHSLWRLLDGGKAKWLKDAPKGSYADTFVFVGEVASAADLDAVVVGSSGTAQRVVLKNAPASVCLFAGGSGNDCRILFIANAPKTKSTPSKHLEHFDTHFAQLYRLLDSYEPSGDKLADDVYVPVGEMKHEVRVTVIGDGSPRCYGGIVTP